MSTHKHIDKICCIIMALSLLVTFIFMNGEALGIEAKPNSMGYEKRIFDNSKMHTIDIVMNDWDSFIAECENEEYSACTVIIDGEAYSNVGIRAKGNTSLSSVSQMNSERYSFKIEFDQYDGTKSYYGLDKLTLNNVIQDNSYMKDYIVYTLMNEFSVSSPLCSYVYITVNGEDYGLYLAVEGVEESFLKRNYGNDYGELYKPDSLSFGGGRGNGKNFNFEDLDFENFDFSQAPQDLNNFMPFDNNGDAMMPQNTLSGDNADFEKERSFGGMSMGSSDVKLQYTDDDAQSYSNIFNNAKTDISDADQTRLIEALKTLGGENASDAVDIEAVIRYFVVHNFVVNGDSYTGSMVHNYYLYEEEGKLSMIPWDYNLAYGTFQGNDAESAVNDAVDSPLDSDGSDRPMLGWVLESEEYTELYHEYFSLFISECFDSGYFEELIDTTKSLIAPYVEKDPTKFCTYEEFEKGTNAIKNFCLLRAQSVKAQLAGTIPSKSEERTGDGYSLVDASSLTISDMGTMGGFGGGFNKESFGGKQQNVNEKTELVTAEPTVTKDANETGEPPTDAQTSMEIQTAQAPQTGGKMPNGGFMQGGIPTDMPQDGSGNGNTQGGFVRPDMSGMGEMPNMEDFADKLPSGTASAGSNGAQQWVILGICVIILAVATLFVYKYKR